MLCTLALAAICAKTLGLAQPDLNSGVAAAPALDASQTPRANYARGAMALAAFT
jgi:hypothetical protein